MESSEDDRLGDMLSFFETGEGRTLGYAEAMGRVHDAMNGYREDYQSAPISGGEDHVIEDTGTEDDAPPSYASLNTIHLHHANKYIVAANIRALDEQDMQDFLRRVQLRHRIFNSDIEPEHDTLIDCNCSIHRYRSRKLNRLDVQNIWSNAVIYPGEKAYHDCYQSILLSNNPYRNVTSPYGSNDSGQSALQSNLYTLSLQQTVQLNRSLNEEAQAAVNAKEPLSSIWDINVSSSLTRSTTSSSDQHQDGNQSISAVGESEGHRRFNFQGLRRTFLIMSPEERITSRSLQLRDTILAEERGRWPDGSTRQVVAAYQERVGMTQEVEKLRSKCPIQYLHLLRAGYFEPIPPEWANSASNPLRFQIDAPAGWRGITPSWRGFQNIAEERLYWALNHRDGRPKIGTKPSIISAVDMARLRLASTDEIPPAYYSDDEAYSSQAIPITRVLDSQEHRTGSTIILLDASTSMDMIPPRPNYDGYLITGHFRYGQRKGKDISKGIVRRFVDAMSHHDNNTDGYQLVSFSTEAEYVGFINRHNFEWTWGSIEFVGTSRLMTGFQKAKDLHFQQYPESATYHPIYGWQAGPKTPMLRLLLIINGETNGIPELELELLSLPWVRITIFLMGANRCMRHHQLANELQRMSFFLSNLSFVDAQGNIPERFVTHELLKRHLGYNLSMAEFEALEKLPPPYAE